MVDGFSSEWLDGLLRNLHLFPLLVIRMVWLLADRAINKRWSERR